MAAVTGTGGLSAFTTRRSVPGLAAGLAVAALFGLGGLQIAVRTPAAVLWSCAPAARPVPG